MDLYAECYISRPHKPLQVVCLKGSRDAKHQCERTSSNLAASVKLPPLDGWSVLPAFVPLV